MTATDAGGGGGLLRIDYLPFHHQAEGLVGAFHQADRLLSVATQRNFIDVDQLVSHLEVHGCCLAALFNLNRTRTDEDTGEMSFKKDQNMSNIHSYQLIMWNGFKPFNPPC